MATPTHRSGEDLGGGFVVDDSFMQAGDDDGAELASDSDEEQGLPDPGATLKRKRPDQETAKSKRKRKEKAQRAKKVQSAASAVFCGHGCLGEWLGLAVVCSKCAKSFAQSQQHIWQAKAIEAQTALQLLSSMDQARMLWGIYRQACQLSELEW